MLVRNHSQRLHKMGHKREGAGSAPSGGLLAIAAAFAVFAGGFAAAQEEAAGEQAEEEAPIDVTCRFVRDDVICEVVQAVGTQIRGAEIGGMLPVSVLTAEDIELFGVDSGDELLELLPEQGRTSSTRKRTSPAA